MKLGALVLPVLFATGLNAADIPSFESKADTFATPPLSLGDMLKNNKPPTLTFNSPTFGATMPGRLPPAPSAKPGPTMRIVKPRTDIDFKMIVREPNPDIDSKFIAPAPQPPAKLGGGK